MNQQNGNDSLKTFFKALVSMFIMCAICTNGSDIISMTPVKFIKYSSFMFMWCVIVSSLSALFTMVGVDFYLWIKKN